METTKVTMVQAGAVPRLEVVLRHPAARGRVMGAEAASLPVVAGMFEWVADFPQEVLLAVSLDGRSRIRHFAMVAMGGGSMLAVTAAEVLRPAILTNSRGLILIHNHPDGDPRPSHRDVDFTRRIRRACQAMGIALHEHLVIGWNGFFCRVCQAMDTGDAALAQVER